MFDFLRRPDPQAQMQLARKAFENVVNLQSDSRKARSLRVRMALLCRAHLDKTFVAGAEQTASWQELSALALANGRERPPLPVPSCYQKIQAGEDEVYTYMPDDYVREAFALGSRYQRMEINASQAIEAMQGLANQVCLYELRLEEPFRALQFLRAELAEQSSQEAALQTPQAPAAPMEMPAPRPS